jgi:hypothetical protein
MSTGWIVMMLERRYCGSAYEKVKKPSRLERTAKDAFEKMK